MKSSRRKEGAAKIIGLHGKAVDNSAEFHGLFSAQFLQRYAELFEALAQPVQHVAMLNALADVNDCDEMGLISYYRQGPISCLRYPEPPAASPPPPPDCPYTQLRQFYWMDFASVLPPLLLAPQPHHAVLDMCAAPGGKSMVLALQLLKGVPAQQQQQQSSTAAAGLATGLLEQLALQEQQETQQQPLQDQALCHVQQEPEPELEEKAQTEAVQPNRTQQQAGLHVADGPAGQQQLQVPAAAEADAPGTHSSSDAAHDEELDDDAAAGGTAPAGGHASGAQQPGRLVCNELDPIRRQRLGTVLAAYLPGSLRRRVRLSGHDASKHWATFEAGMYDRVLLDAPCSSERHVVQQAVQGGGVVLASSWSKEHCKQLAALQLKMLLGGLRALKPGGRLVYSTSSLAEVENDAVVHKALQQQQQGGSQVRVVPAEEWGLAGIEELAGGERTQHGLICLPDTKGWGPTYLAVLEKGLIG